MSDAVETEDKARKERSPSFPFISLEKAVGRARAIEERHKRDPARLTAVGITWGYAAKSSGLLQTAAALIQFGLLENVGSGPDRKVQLTELARRILFDTRDGVREKGLKEAALKPRMIAECFEKWGKGRPSDDHCVSYLVFDRAFNEVAAHTFLKTYDETVTFANLEDGDAGRDNLSSENNSGEPPFHAPVVAATPVAKSSRPFAWAKGLGAARVPTARRSSVTLSGGGTVTIEYPEGLTDGELPELKLFFDFTLQLAEKLTTENEKKRAAAEGASAGG